MRDIKFRGKNILTNEWEYGSLFMCKLPSGEHSQHPYDGAIILKSPKIDREHFNEKENYALAFTADEIAVVTPCSVGQLTGLKDKNNKDIWEGDIVRVSFYFRNKISATANYIVGTQESNYALGKNGRFEYALNDPEVRNIEVIGNVIDNPDKARVI